MSDRTASDRAAASAAGSNPGPAEIDQRFTAARSMAVAAGRMLQRHFRGPLETRVKEQTSQVTNADEEVEAELRRRILRKFPDDSVLGEELGLDERGGDWCWTLDPLDGTHNFITGMPLYAVAIAVLHRREPVIAVVHDPSREETYAAARGRGTRLNGVPVHVSAAPVDAFSLIAVQHRFLRGPRAALLELLPTRKFRCLGSICLEMAHVAAGSLTAVIASSAHLWEVAAGAVLIQEAGGVLHGPNGSRLFPLEEPLATYVDRRFRMLGGSPAGVEVVGAHLSRIPL